MRMFQSQLGQLESVRQNMQDLVNPNRMYERLGVDILSLQVGSNLLVIADPDQERTAACENCGTSSKSYG